MSKRHPHEYKSLGRIGDAKMRDDIKVIRTSPLKQWRSGIIELNTREAEAIIYIIIRQRYKELMDSRTRYFYPKDDPHRDTETSVLASLLNQLEQ